MKTLLISLLIGTSLLSSLVLPVQAYRYDETTRRSSNIEYASTYTMDATCADGDSVSDACLKYLLSINRAMTTYSGCQATPMNMGILYYLLDSSDEVYQVCIRQL